MKLIGILSWYDESPSWLTACVASMVSHAEIDHLVAVDGAYALLPGGRAFSGFEQHQTIDELCRASQVGLTLHAPREVWFGNEVEKRSFAFQLAEQMTDSEEDWYFIMDADQVVTCAINLRQILTGTDKDVGQTWFYERFDPHETPGLEKVAHRVAMPRECSFPVHNLFRALPRLHVAENHYSYLTGNGRQLWAGKGSESVAVDSRMEIEHRTRLRDMARKEQQQAYYKRRDELGIEKVYLANADLGDEQPMEAIA